MDAVNQRWYARPQSVAAFAGDDRLEPALVRLFLDHHHRLAGRPMLDIGVGAGRTTRYLHPLSPHYVGLDYSPAMVAHAARRFPAARIELGDGRDLSRFGPGRFHFVLFSYCGIGALAHDGRLALLREVRRVLHPDGRFAFSAHHRDCAWARRRPTLARSRNPFTQLAQAARWMAQQRNHRRLRPLERETPEYALVNDMAEEYALLHYYISEPAQRAQLEAEGLAVETVLDSDGAPVAPGRAPAASPWLWYVVRRG
jgi:SAM-dependent methyltransferase